MKQKKINFKNANAEGVNRTYNLQFRVTEAELQQIEKRQEEVGILNRSSYLRKMALNGICIHIESDNLRKASMLLSKTSKNMNQYAKKANSTGSIYGEDIDDIKEKLHELILLFGKVLDEFNKISEVID